MSRAEVRRVEGLEKEMRDALDELFGASDGTISRPDGFGYVDMRVPDKAVQMLLALHKKLYGGW